MNSSESIKQKAVELGFDLVGIAGAGPIEQEQIRYLRNWLDSGCAAGMEYMHKNFEKRANPAELLENAKSVICVGLNYRPENGNEISVGRKLKGKIANFALYQDYHEFIKQRLFKLADFIKENINESARCKVCVDSAPVAERTLAERAGLGFIGKNHMLINEGLGGQILLAEIITDVELQTDEAAENKCDGCDKCIAACPTTALGKDGSFDANKCISYLTIEHKGEIASEFAAKIGEHLFGCDECILACPFEENAPAGANKDFRVVTAKWLELEKVLDWSQKEFDEAFKDSTIKRLSLERLKRNAKTCLNNLRRI